MTEIEVKITIEEPGYRKVLDHFNAQMVDELDQWNVFFDTPENHARRTARTIRLRSVKSQHKEPQWFFTVKRGGSYSAGVASRPEIETEISDKVAQELLSTPSHLYKMVPKIIQKEIEDCEKVPFMVIGDMRTIRRVIPFDGLTLECDELMLPNGDTFFEIEIENDDPKTAKEKIEAKLNSLQVSWVFSPRGKFGRLMSIPEEKRFSRPFPSE